MKKGKETIGIFAYCECDPGLKRVLEPGNYKVLWIFPYNQIAAAITAMRGQPPDIVVVNPYYERRLGDYRTLLPETTKLVVDRHPFGEREIRIPPQSVPFKGKPG